MFSVSWKWKLGFVPRHQWILVPFLMITNWDHCIWRTWINPPCKSGLDPIDCKSSLIIISLRQSADVLSAALEFILPPQYLIETGVLTLKMISSLPPFLWTTGTKFRRGRCFGAHCKKSQMKIFSITRALLFIWNKTKQMFYLCLFKSGTMFSQSSKPTLNIINVRKFKKVNSRWL